MNEEEIIQALPTRYREVVERVIAETRANVHEHAGVLIGTGVHCITCGAFLGVTTVAFPTLDWEKWRAVRERVHPVLLAALAELPGIHAETAAEYLADRIAYDEVGSNTERQPE